MGIVVAQHSIDSDFAYRAHDSPGFPKSRQDLREVTRGRRAYSSGDGYGGWSVLDPAACFMPGETGQGGAKHEGARQGAAWKVVDLPSAQGFKPERGTRFDRSFCLFLEERDLSSVEPPRHSRCPMEGRGRGRPKGSNKSHVSRRETASGGETTVPGEGCLR